MRLILPIILIVAALGLFVAYTNPAYQSDLGLQTQVASYDDALNKSQELLATRDQLLSKRNTFSTDDVQKITHMLPDNVDNIRLIIDINNIAARRGLALQNVALGEVSDASTQRSALAVGPSGGAVGSVELGFAVTASYDDFLAFLQDLEHSLRIVDVEKITFASTPTPTGKYSFSFTIRTYWLH